MNHALLQHLSTLNESTWIHIGKLSESLLLLPIEKSLTAFESALRIHPFSKEALMGLAGCYRNHELYPQAIEMYQRLVQWIPHSGEAWAGLGHCYLRVTFFFYYFPMPFLFLTSKKKKLYMKKITLY